ncbi:MAG: hypothetical protein H8D42_00535 [Candidatus Marinimicrobia bacterium]|nr:hypothetical protein [Candidatus Neomarinimicrobiota bacterium]
MTTNCKICHTLTPPSHSQQIEIYDTVLLESQNFVVVPTVGALVEGWLLLLPKEHFLCIGALSNDLIIEFNEMTKLVSEIVESCYGSVTIFEHGPSKCKEPVGCGVDHAHLHFVPIEADLIMTLSRICHKKLYWNRIDDMFDLKFYYENAQSYLFIKQSDNDAYATTHQNLGSQLFRKAIAETIGFPERFNWRQYPEIENVTKTVNKIREYIANIEILK